MRSFIEREYPVEPEDTEELIRTDPSYVPTQDEFAAWESSKKENGLVGWAKESLENFDAGEVASRLTDVVSQGVGGLFSDPLKAPASAVEGIAQGGAQLDGLLLQSQNPSSPAFRFRSWITGNDTVKDRYMQFLEAREYNKWLGELDEGAKTVLIDKGYVNPELTRLVGTVADPSTFVPFAPVGKLLAKGAAVGVAKPLGAAGRVATKVGGAGERFVDNALKTVGDVVGVGNKDAVKAAALGGSIANQVSGGGTGTVRKLINAPTLVRAGGQIAEAAADRLRNAPTRVGPMEGLGMLPNATPVDRALGFIGTHGGDAAIDMGLHGAADAVTGAAVGAGLGLWSDPDNTLNAAFEGSLMGGAAGSLVQGVGRVTGRSAKAARANDLTRFINSDDKNAGAVKAVSEAHGVDAAATFMDTINLARGVLGDIDVNVLDSTGWATRELPRARGIYVDTREGGQIFINQDILTREGAKATDAAQTLGHELFHALKEVEQLAPQVQALRDAVMGKTIPNSSGGVDMVREGLVTGEVLERLWQRYRDMAPDEAKADMDRMTSESDRREYIFDEVGGEYLGQLLAGGNPDTVLRAHNSLRSNIADMLIKHRTDTFLGKAAGWFAQRGMRDVDSILFHGDIPKATALANAMLRDLVRARAKLGERIVRDGDASHTVVRKGDLGEAGVGELMEDIGLATRDPASGKYKWKSVGEVESKSREEVSALMEILSRYADPTEGGMEPDGDAVAGSRLSPSQLSAIEADMRISNKLKEMLKAISASTKAMEDGDPNVLQMVYGAATTRRRNKLTDRFRSVYSSGVKVSTRTIVPFDLRLEADTNAGNPYVRGLDLSKLRNDARDAASKGGLGPWGRDYGAFARDMSRYVALMDNPSTPPGRAAEIFGADNAGVLARWLSAKEKGGSKYVHSFRLDRMIKLDPTGEHHRMSTETWRRAEVRYQPVGDNLRRGSDGSTLVKGSRGWRRYRKDGKLAGVHSTESGARIAAAKDRDRDSLNISREIIKRTLGSNEEYARAFSDSAVKAALVRANGSKGVKGLKTVLPNGKIVLNETAKPISDAYGAARKLPEGTKVAVRIDIPTFNRSPENARVYAQTIHVPGNTGEVPGPVLGYDRAVRLKNVQFSVKQSTAERIKSGELSKSPIATAIGEYQHSKDIPTDIEMWTPVGMDPKDHSYFYDKATDEPVVSADEAFSVGNTVFVKNPVYGDRSDYRFMPVSESGEVTPDSDGFHSVLEKVVMEKVPRFASRDQIMAAVNPAKGSGVKPDELKWVGFEDRMDKLKEQYGNKIPKQAVIAATNESYRVLSIQDAGDQYKAYVLQGYNYYRESALTINDRYTSNHYRGVDGYVAHMRVTERIDGNDVTGLLIEEMQSDRHQEARKQGGYAEGTFTEDELKTLANYNLRKDRVERIERWNKRLSESIRLRDLAVARIEKKTGEPASSLELDSQNRMVEGAQRWLESYTKQLAEFGGPLTPDEAQAHAELLNRHSRSKTGVPDAPFRSSAAWGLALFKHALRDSIQTGDGWIGWTAGVEQVKRWKNAFRQAVDEIKWRDDGHAHLVGARKDGNTVFLDFFDKESGLSAKQYGDKQQVHLSDVVGKQIANEILSGKANSSGKGEASWAGDQLTIGGEGFKGFYDEILPKEIGKYVKQWGAKVEQTTLMDPDSPETAVGKIWRVDITPQMRESITRMGQPRFMPAPADLKPVADFTPKVKAADVTVTKMAIPGYQAKIRKHTKKLDETKQRIKTLERNLKRAKTQKGQDRIKAEIEDANDVIADKLKAIDEERLGIKNAASQVSVTLGKRDKKHEFPSIAKAAILGMGEKGEPDRALAYQRLDGALAKVADDPARFADPNGYADFFREAGVYGNIMLPPPMLRTLVNRPGEYVDLVTGGYHGNRTVPGTREAAFSGLDGVMTMREAIQAASGSSAPAAPPPMIVALHHMWGILSRMLAPLHQEAGWMRLASQPEVVRQLQASIDGQYALDREGWKAVVADAFYSTAQPDKLGNSSKSNANSFHDMLEKWNGKWDRAANIYATDNSKDMGRRFWAMGAGAVGIRNKVQRFIGLTFGIPALIMDRWKYVEFFYQQYGMNLREFVAYDSNGVPADITGLYGGYGKIEADNPHMSLVFYEGMEAALNAVIKNSPELRELLTDPKTGRQHHNAGGLHWLGWNAIKNEAVGHSSLNMTYDLLKGGDWSPEAVVEQFSKNEYFVEGLNGSTIQRFTLRK
jgi:predicted nuclease with TOPRIM domain